MATLGRAQLCLLDLFLALLGVTYTRYSTMLGAPNEVLLFVATCRFIWRRRIGEGAPTAGRVAIESSGGRVARRLDGYPR